ncbi:MAG: hypothetical protein ACI9HK_003499, partial [Pirellulaceae bacterium]
KTSTGLATEFGGREQHRFAPRIQHESVDST